MSGNYKFLQDRLEEGSGFIEKFTMLALEEVRCFQSDSVSEFMEEFFDRTPKQLCDILNFKKEKEVYARIEGCYVDCGKREGHSELLGFIIRAAGMDGFLAEIRTPRRQNFRFKDDGTYSSCELLTGWQQIDWIYAETYSELVEKTIITTNKNVEDMRTKEFEELFGGLRVKSDKESSHDS